ncbi:hypothetical protein WG66_012490 [Moniliophthora roreri]|nr:hypothetical protein WG66_012490 [Moniliophthora roreri]
MESWTAYSPFWTIQSAGVVQVFEGVKIVGLLQTCSQESPSSSPDLRLIGRTSTHLQGSFSRGYYSASGKDRA